MEKRALGTTGLSIAPLALGGNVFGWTADIAASFAVLDAFVDHGFDLVDTANMYSAWGPGHSGGESESVIGQWLAQSGKRDKIILATKVGMPMGDGSQGLKKEYIIKSAEDSLKRLQTDVIDLYQSHQDDPTTPFEETLAAYDTLIRQGKVRAIGASNYDAPRLAAALDAAAAHDLPSYGSLQPEYNLYNRADFEDTLAPLCLERGIGVISYYGLASGFLTGKYRRTEDLAQSVRGAGIGERYLNPRGLRILGALDDVAAAHDSVPAVIALAWLIQRPAITAPIVSATSAAQFETIARAAHVKLSAGDIAALDAASAP